jgi:hypothetical protein
LPVAQTAHGRGHARHSTAAAQRAANILDRKQARHTKSNKGHDTEALTPVHGNGHEEHPNNENGKEKK